MLRKSLVAAAFLLPLIALPAASNAGSSNTAVSQQIAPDQGYQWVYRGGPKATPSWEKK